MSIAQCLSRIIAGNHNPIAAEALHGFHFFGEHYKEDGRGAGKR